MKLEDKGIVRVLTPDLGYKLYSIVTNEYYRKVYLGVNDSEDNYREVEDEEYTMDVFNEINNTKSQVEKHEAEIQELQSSQVSLVSILEEEVNK